MGTSDTDDYLWVSPRVITRTREERRLSESYTNAPTTATTDNATNDVRASAAAGAAADATSTIDLPTTTLDAFEDIETLDATECYASYGARCRSDQPNARAADCVPASDARYICPFDYPTCVGAYDKWTDPTVGANCHPYVTVGGAYVIREYDFATGVFMGLNADGDQRTMGGTVQECKDRCSSTYGCDFVSYERRQQQLPPAHGGGALFPVRVRHKPGITHYPRTHKYGVCTTLEPTLSVVFSPLANTRHRTLSSAHFFTDLNSRHQALLIGTGAESPNALAYLGFPDFTERYVGTEDTYVETVAVAAKRLDRPAGMLGVNLLCFANRGSKNTCTRMEVAPNMDRSNMVVGDLQAQSFSPPPPSPLSDSAGRRMADASCEYSGYTR